MGAEMRSHVFEPFFTTKEISKGAGLGLPTVLGIVEQSGGAISCNSALGKGTQFTLWLPAATGRADVIEHASGGLAQAPKGSSEVVLLVEDEATVRMLRHDPGESGVRRARSEGWPGGAIVDQARDGPIDILVSDVVLPEWGGRECGSALVLRPHMKLCLYLAIPKTRS